MALLFYVLILLFLVIFVAVTLFIVMSITISTAFGAPYVRSAPERLESMMEVIDTKKIKKMLDLGSGDGTIMLEFAKRGVKAYGYEINPFLVWGTNKKIRKLGLDDKAHAYWINFWFVDFRKKDFDLITIYGIPWIMGMLGKKLKRELKPGTKIISNYFVLLWA
jgi:SAM-dependent methyltransferase